MNENAMMKKMGRGMAKAKTQEASSMKKPAKKAPLPKPVKKEFAMGGKAYAKGGGCEIKGKTKGTMVKMAKGGSSC